MKIEKDSRQVPNTEDIMSDRNFCDLLYCYLQSISNWDVEKGIGKYIEIDKINYSLIGSILNKDRRTIKKKFEYLLNELQLIEKKENVYELVLLDNKDAFLLPQSTISLLVDTTNDNVFKIYIYLLNRFCANKYQPFEFTIDKLKSIIGYSTNHRDNNNIVNNILMVLSKLGLITFDVCIRRNEKGQIETVHTLRKAVNKIV